MQQREKSFCYIDWNKSMFNVSKQRFKKGRHEQIENRNEKEVFLGKEDHLYEFSSKSCQLLYYVCFTNCKHQCIYIYICDIEYFTSFCINTIDGISQFMEMISSSKGYNPRPLDSFSREMKLQPYQWIHRSILNGFILIMCSYGCILSDFTFDLLKNIPFWNVK